MHVAVGSENPVKVAAVETALAALDPTVSGVAVDSGVPDQPRSIAETVAGAENRARRACERTIDGQRGPGGGVGTDGDRTAAFGVGIEGGVADLDAPGTYLVMWAAATDGDRVERGAGPSLRLPDQVAARVRDGAELGPALDDLLGTEGVARREGAAGVLTDGLTNRQAALEQAVACAFGPFRCAYYP